jgi:small nuclear ribonucleoprotein (snRNP)-like protein
VNADQDTIVDSLSVGYLRLSSRSIGCLRSADIHSQTIAHYSPTDLIAMTDPHQTHQLRALLGTTLRLLLKDNRTIQGSLESIDHSSLLLSRVLETRAPPTTEEEWEIFENRDRYYPRTDGGVYEIEGMGIARDIGAVLVQMGDVVKVEVDKGEWARVRGLDGII